MKVERVRKRNQEGIVGGRVGDPPGEGKRGGLGVGRYATGIDRGARPDFPARETHKKQQTHIEKTEKGREEEGTPQLAMAKQFTHHLGDPEGGPWTERKG